MRTNLFQPLAGETHLNSLRRSIAAANSFLPSDLSGLQLWLESSPIAGYLFTATGGTGQAAHGNAVAHWKDRSSNARNVTEVTAKPALANTLAPTQPNGRATLTFTAASAHRLAAAAAAPWKFLHDGTGCTGFVVYKQTNENIGVLLDSGGYPGGSNTGLMLYADDSSTTEGRLALAIGKGSNIVNLSGPVAASNSFPAAVWHIARFSYIESGTPAEALLFGDGCFYISGNTSAAPSSSNPTAALRIGLDIDGVSSNVLALDGSVAAVILYNRVLTTAESRQVESYLSLGWTVPIGNVAVLGDSIMAGTDVTRIPATAIANRLGPLWRASNFAVSGARVATGSPQVSSSQWSDTGVGARRRGYNVIVLLAGVNDLDNDYGAAATYADLANLYNDVLAEPNSRLVVCTVMPWKGNSAWTSGREAQRITLNGSIRAFAAANANTHLVDLAAVMADPADAEAMWAPYVLDYLHPNQAGSDALAAAVADKLLAVGLG